MLSIEYRRDGKTTATHTYGDFVEVAGAWWVGKIESLDDKGRLTSVIKQSVVRLDAEKFAQAIGNRLAGREKIQFLRDPARKVIDAKNALKAGNADFSDRITLMMHFLRSQQWTRAMEHFDAAEKLAAGKPGLRWLRFALLKSARRNEELKNSFQQEAAALANSPRPNGDGPGVRVAAVDDGFLANYLLNQSAGVLENNERLALLDSLQPVFARQPEYRLAIKQWKRARADCLANCGREDEALSLCKELADTYPNDISVQQKYLQNLQNRQEFAALRKWIDHLLSSDTPWEPSETDQLRGAFADSLRSQERYEELAAYLGRWIEQNPVGYEPFYQYLDALLYNDRVEEAYALVDKWFQEGRRDDIAPSSELRLHAAVAWILTENHWNGYGTEKARDHWQRQLIETAAFFARNEAHVSIADWVLDNWQFRQSEACREAKAKLGKILAENFDRMNVKEINRFVEWLRGEEKIVDKNAWKTYARRLHERAVAESDTEHKYQLLQAARNIYSFSLESAEYLAFLRQLVAESPEKYRAVFVSQLFDVLLNQSWSEQCENEAFDLLDKLQSGATPPEQLLNRIRALHRLTDRMLQIRLEARNKAIEHPEKLTRSELAAKQAENLRKTREEFATRLSREETKHAGPLVAWITAERLFLDVQLGRNLEQAAEICWKALDAKLPRIDENSDAAACLQAELDCALRNRYLVTVMNLAARRNAAPQAIRRLLDYLDQNITRVIAEQTENQQWKLLKYELLIALDRPADLEKTLDEWIRSGDADNRWRTALGYVLAEQGKLKEAIATFEAVAAADELGADECRALADWYQAEGRRADYEKSKLQIFETMNEWEIEQALDSQIKPWLINEGQLPSGLSPDVFWAFQALLEKSADPAKYISGQLLPLYRACRDFRLLACLADSVPGHTAEQIYPFLRSSRAVIDEIRDEAAVDSLSERIAELRAKVATDIDRRAFDLLEAMTERRASELKNQPGPHVEKAVAALKQASKHQWSPGEERLMAEFLADLGVIPQERLAAEQRRQLEEFYATSKEDTQQRLDMACAWAKALWNYSRRQAAIDLLESEVRQYPRSKSDNAKLPGSPSCRKRLMEQQVFVDYVSYLCHTSQFETTVNQLQSQLERETAEARRNDLVVRIFEVQLNALQHGGQVAGFRGARLYRDLQGKILAKLPSDNSPLDARLISVLGSVYSEAGIEQITAAAADLKSFAFGKFHDLLRRQVQQDEKLVSELCERVHTVCGPADGIAFLLDCRDRQPRWLRIRQDFWNVHGNRLTAWRKEVKNLDPKLSDRLLRLVLEQLRDGLLGRRDYNLPICYNSCPAVFWAEHEGDFLRTAEEVYAENENSEPIVLNVADYLVQGLDRLDRAIEMLRTANDGKLLDCERTIEVCRLSAPPQPIWRVDRDSSAAVAAKSRLLHTAHFGILPHRSPRGLV